MNEEEKQAIECEIELKYVTNKEFNIKECFYILKKRYFSDDTEIKAINYLEQFIDKQQKEIEKLKSRKYIINAETNEIKEIPISDDYISKDKIRHIRDKAECMDYYSLNDVIDDLTKLLGE